MLVVDPGKRCSLGQVKRHRWMLVDVASPADPSQVAKTPAPQWQRTSTDVHEEEPNEQILRLMQSLGVDPVKTRDSLQHQKYDHHAAIYYLLVERRSHLTAATNVPAGSVTPGPAPCAESKAVSKRSTEQVNSNEGAAVAEAAAAAATVATAAVPGPALHRTRPLWAHSPPFRDSACGDSVDSERGSVGGSLLSPLMETSSPMTERNPMAAGCEPLPVKVTTYSIDEGVETDQLGHWESTESPLGSTTSAGSTFGSLVGDPVQDLTRHDTPPVEREDPLNQSQRLQGNGLGLPALFHEGRRASDGLVCRAPATATPTRSIRGGPAQEGAVPLAETHREHRALCLQYQQLSKTGAEEQPTPTAQPRPLAGGVAASGTAKMRPVLRQTSYKLAQQQPFVLPPVPDTPVTELQRICQPIAEDGGSDAASPPDPSAVTGQRDWCRLPSTLAACNLNPTTQQ